MQFRCISKFLILIVFLNGILQKNSFASSDRYEIFEGENYSITNILEEQEADIEIHGNTLVNLLNTSKLPMKFDKFSSVEDRYVFLQEVHSVQPLKANRTYTIYIKYRIDSYSKLSDDSNRTKILPKLIYTDGTIDYLGNFSLRRKDGTYIETIAFIPSKDVKLCEIGWAVKNATVSGELLEAVLLDGDYRNNKIKYFEGLKSSGQNDSNSLELILSRGNPNLIKGSDWTLTATKDTEAKPESVSYGIDSSINLQDLIGKNLTFSFFVHTKGESINNPNKPIYGSENSRFGIHMGATWGDSTGVKSNVTNFPFSRLITNENIDNRIVVQTGIINPPNGYDTLLSLDFATQPYRLPAPNNDETWILSRPKLEYGDYNTNWSLRPTEDVNKEYHQNIKFNLDQPLRSLPNGVCDKIVKKDGKWVIERNTKEIILNDSFDWKIKTSGSIQNVFYINISDMIIGLNGNVSVQSDRYKAYDSHEHWFLVNGKGIANGQNDIELRVKDNDFNTVEEFKNSLKDNPITLVYQLQKPVYTSLSTNETPFLYKDVTTIYSNSDIFANIKISVDRVANRAKDAINTTKINPSVLNFSIARYWSNLLKDSILKDSFQSELNSICGVNDLVLETKTSSHNADVYITMRNNLSLSIDTNNITFNDFNASEDFELKNAVNLTVSSSIPYKINAYLESEIYNTDKTKIIDKSILNIKASNDTTYKAFKNISEALLLLDNQAEGLSNSHSIDLMLRGSGSYKADIYKTVLKFEVVQK